MSFYSHFGNIHNVGIIKLERTEKQEQVYTIPSTVDGATRRLLPEKMKKIDDDGVIPAYSTSIIGKENIPDTEIGLIKAYRDLAKSSDVDEAIKEIVNESFSSDGMRECFRPKFKPDTKITASTQKKIDEAFDHVYHSLFDFDRYGQIYFRQWYIDGRIAFHMAVDKKEKTIKHIQPLDVLVTKKIKTEYFSEENGMIDNNSTKVFYYHIPQQFNTPETQTKFWSNNNYKDKWIYKFEDEAIAWADSGLVDPSLNLILSHLYKAIVPYNNMKMMEEAMMIYRIVRAPERRAFYIDVGSMGTAKAMQYVNDIRNTFNNKTVFDSSTNSFINKKSIHAMTEDYYLPRRDGQKGTSIESIGGAENLGVTKDIEYLRDKFYRSLNVPAGRLNPEMQQSMLMLGRVTEMNRDEYRFKRFIDDLRRNFIPLIEKVLMTELILRGVTTKQEWCSVITKDLFWDFIEDNSFVEIKKNEKTRSKLELLDAIQNYVGVYFSKEWVFKELLLLSEKEIDEMKEQMEEEKEAESDSPFGNDNDDGDSDSNDNKPQGNQRQFTHQTTQTNKLEPKDQDNDDDYGEII